MFMKTCCRLCLSVNKRTVNIYRTDLLYLYELLANFKVKDSECWVCYICQTKLQQCHRLQQLAVQTRSLVDGLCRNKCVAESYAKKARWETASHNGYEDGIFLTWNDGEKLQETDVNIGAIGSLLKLSIYKQKNFSTIPPIANNIKEEPDIKTEQYNEDGEFEEQTVENTNGQDYAPVIEFEDDDHVSNSDAVCKQESLSVDRIDAWQGSRVFELNLVKLSQSVIDKYVRRSPTTQHTATEEHVRDKGKCAGEQSVENDDKKAQYKSHKEQVICDVCLKMFPNKSRLLMHIRTHTGESILKEHMLIHTGEKPYNCDICQKKFVTKGNLKTHVLLIHTGAKPFNCHICQKKFGRKSILKKHMLIHTGEKPFNCNICQKKLGRKSNLKKHMLIHTGEKPYNLRYMPKEIRNKT